MDIIVKMMSNIPHVGSIVVHGDTPWTPSASAWAESASGREAFRRQFRFMDGNGSSGVDTNPPRDYLVSNHQPSREWLEAKRGELATILSKPSIREDAEVTLSDIPLRRAIQMEYMCQLETALRTPPAHVVEKNKEYDAADALRNAEYDTALSKHFELLLTSCTKINKLRRELPSPTEAEWATVINSVVTAAVGKWAWAFKRLEAEPRAQAMPRPFSDKPCETRLNPHLRPKTFQPDRGIYIERQIEGFALLDARQRMCLTSAKKTKNITVASLPVAAVEYKPFASDLPHAEGQALYSAVQAAGIYQNVRSDLEMLTLSIAHGFVQPAGSRWAGENAPGGADIATIRGAQLDLCQLSAVVHLFLMIYNAAQTHVQAAFEVSREALASYEEDPACPLKPVFLTAGPLVDWRQRSGPKHVKRKAEGQPLKSPSAKRAKGVGQKRADDDESDRTDSGNDNNSYYRQPGAASFTEVRLRLTSKAAVTP
ncbi:hypothetical protein C8R44DRAFT_870092 [Mycena epipterygia]|nr:hypothetical protein C8R44DRAFT_870092 [Mycena epipterygia]